MSTSLDPPARYRSYLVRLWRVGGDTRVVLQDVATGGTRRFDSVAALCAWLSDGGVEDPIGPVS